VEPQRTGRTAATTRYSPVRVRTVNAAAAPANWEAVYGRRSFRSMHPLNSVRYLATNEAFL